MLRRDIRLRRSSQSCGRLTCCLARTAVAEAVRTIGVTEVTYYPLALRASRSPLICSLPNCSAGAATTGPFFPASNANCSRRPGSTLRAAQKSTRLLYFCWTWVRLEREWIALPQSLDPL